MSQAVRFEIRGLAVPKGRPRVYRGRAVTPEATRRWETYVRLASKRYFRAPFAGPVRIELSFTVPDLRRRDWDNLAKSVTDALNGIAYEDDSQIWDARVVKWLSNGPQHVRVLVEAA